MNTNTEKFVIFSIPKMSGLYFNSQCNWSGNKIEAEEYAVKHNYGGGIEIENHLNEDEYDCENACPDCGDTDIDWQGSESDDGNFYEQRGKCKKCECSFIEYSTRIYDFTKIEE